MATTRTHQHRCKLTCSVQVLTLNLEVYPLDSVASDYHNMLQPLNDLQVTANCDTDVTQVKKIKKNERKITTF